MGRRRTYVGTSIARVMEDDMLPNSIKLGLTEALHGNGDIVDHVMENMVNSIAFKAEKLYRFAEDGNYIHGLPSGQYALPGDSITGIVKAVLDTLHGQAVTLSYAHHGPANLLHIGWEKLFSDYSYNPITNKMPQALGLYVDDPQAPAMVISDYWLWDMVPVIPSTMVDTVEPLTLVQWGTSPKAGKSFSRPEYSPAMALTIGHSNPGVDPFGINEGVRVSFEVDTTTGIKTQHFFIPITGYDNNADYVHARYTLGTTVYYWTYKIGTGTYSTLDALFDKAPQSNGKFFPFIYFRHQKVSEISNPTSESYLDGKKMAKILNIGYDQIAEGIDANPDIGDIEQAMIAFVVPANSQDPNDQRYLWDFFNNLFLAQTPDLRFRSEAIADLQSILRGGIDILPPRIVIQDQRFKMSLVNRGIYKFKKAGKLGPVGTHTSSRTEISYETIYSLITTYLDDYIITPITYHSFRRQITESIYEEIQVVELYTEFHILNDKTAIGDDDDPILIVPLDHSITEHYSTRERELLYSRSLHYIFNSVVTIKLKWYQTGFFKFVMIVIALVCAYYGMAEVSAQIFAAVTTGAYLVAMSLIFTLVLQAIILQAVFKFFVKKLGTKFAFILAIIAAVASMYIGVQAGSLQGTPWANELLMVSSGLTQAIDAQVKVDIGELIGQMSEFEKYTEEQLKLIDSAKDLLDQNHQLSPFVIFGEKPEDFYNRTIHSGNIGVVSIDALSSFVDSKLTLPTLDQTAGWKMGESTYE
jgi:archaellum component FlaF (FlaF/FlaG flagellin family)